MKTYILFLILIISLLSCKKQKAITPAVVQPAKTAVALRVEDTIPDSASLKVKLKKDSADIDETMFIFNHTSTGIFASSQAASLSSFTTDSVACAIQVLPYRPGASIRLNVNAKRTGVYLLGISYLHKIPAGIHVWLQDSARKDSLDLRVGNYAFYVDKADSTTYGRRRFRVVLR
jgi:hypothetical protein